MSIISRYVYQTAKYALLLCMFCCLLGGNWAHASKVILFSGYDENFGGMPGVTTVVEGELYSIKGVDNYQSQSGVVKAYSMDVSFSVVQDVPGFGKFTNKAYDSSIYFYMNQNGNLKAESDSSIEANILSSDTFLSRLNLLLESSYPEVYQQMLNNKAGSVIDTSDYTPVNDGNDFYEKYKSMNRDRSGNNEIFSISYESSKKTSSVHGKYLYVSIFKNVLDENGNFEFLYDPSIYHEWLQSNKDSVEKNVFGPSCLSFDYDSSSGTFTFYRNNVKAEIAHNYPEDGMYQDLGQQGKSKMTEEFDALGAIQYSLDEHIGQVIYTDGNNKYSLYRFSEDINANLPTMWYKLTDIENPSDWAAFTYDKDNNLFTLYTSDYSGGFIYRSLIVKFIDAEHIDYRSEGVNHTNAPVGELFYKGIQKYVTDGMLLFLNRSQNN